MKKILSITIALLMLAAMVAGCAAPAAEEPAAEAPAAEAPAAEEPAAEEPAAEEPADSGEPAKPEKLTIWIQKTFSDDVNNGMVGLFEEFGEANGIGISVEVIDAAALRDTKLPAAFESGDLPNISFVEPAQLIAYTKQGKILGMQDVADELAANGTTFMQNLLDTSIVDGEIRAIPAYAQCWMLWYRKDKLEAAGYSEGPKTWEEMLEMSKAITNPKEGFYGAGLAAGAAASDFNNMMQSMLWSYGGSVMKDGKINLDSAESKEALQMMLKFFEEGTVAPDMIAGDDMANNTAMLTGTAGFIVNIPTIASALQTDAPDVWEVTGVVPVPGGPEGQYSLASCANTCVLDSGDEGTNYWAKKAIVYAYDKTRLAPMLELIAPAYGMPFADTFEMTEYMSDPVVAAHMEGIKNAQYYNYPDAEFTLERSLLTASTCFINNIVAYVEVEGMSFEDALAKEIEICEEALAAAA